MNARILSSQPSEDEPRPAQAAPAQFVNVGIADTPLGQKVAFSMTVLLDPGDAVAFANGILATAGKLSRSGLIVAAPGSNGLTDAVAQQP